MKYFGMEKVVDPEGVKLMYKELAARGTRRLNEMGFSPDLVSMQGLGYKEILAYLEGNCSLEEAIYILKRDTRHFAKRQLTWFKREKEVDWIELDGKTEQQVLEEIQMICKEKGIL